MLRLCRQIHESELMEFLKIPTVKVEIKRSNNKGNLPEGIIWAYFYIFPDSNLINKISEKSLQVANEIVINKETLPNGFIKCVTEKDRFFERQRNLLRTISHQIKKDQFIPESNILSLLEMGIGNEQINIPYEWSLTMKATKGKILNPKKFIKILNRK